MTAANADNDDDDMAVRSPARGSGKYSVHFRFTATTTSSARLAQLALRATPSLQYAASRVSKLITTKLTDTMRVPPLTMRCHTFDKEVLPPVLSPAVIDLYVLVALEDDDDDDAQAHGEAGPCLFDASGFPRVGYVRLNARDVASRLEAGTLDALCLHQFIHVLGAGPLWQQKQLVTAGEATYVGQGGLRGWKQIAAANQEDDAVRVQGEHWHGDSVPQELMTAQVTAPYQPLSHLTVQSLTDLGYSVDGSAADEFGVVDSATKPPFTARPTTATTARPTSMNNNTPDVLSSDSGFTVDGLDSAASYALVCVLAAVLALCLVVGMCVAYRRVRRERLSQQQKEDKQMPNHLEDEVPVAIAVAPTSSMEKDSKLAQV